MKVYNPIKKYANDYNFLQDTPEWEAFWLEQINRCINGYEGITGRHYFWLNFGAVRDIEKGWIDADYWDIHDEFFKEFEICKETGENLAVLKARRKGFTYAFLYGISIYDMLFFTETECGIGVGTEPNFNEVTTKYDDAFSKLDPFFMVRSDLVDNKELIQYGWEEKMPNGVRKKMGTMNKMHFKLTSSNTGSFKSLIQYNTVFEEAGEYINLKETFNNTRKCWMKGSKKFGTGIVGGTGGNMSEGSKDFAYMWNNPHEFSLRKLFIPASKAYYPFVNPDGTSQEAEAEVYLRDVRKKLEQSKNKTSYYNELQENPLIPEEALLKFGSSAFDHTQLNRIDQYILESKPIVTRGKLDFVKNWKEIYKKEGDYHPSMVEFIPDSEGPCIIRKYPNWQGTDIAGIDGYDQDESETSDSLGCMGIYRTTSRNSLDADEFVFRYLERPPRIKDFNRQCLLAAIFYDLVGEVDLEAIRCASQLSYFEQMNATKYLKPATKKFDDRDSKASNKWGRVMYKPDIKLKIEKISDYMIEHLDKWWDDEFVNQLRYYGSANADIVDAYGICLMRAAEIYAIKGIDYLDEEEEEDEDMPSYTLVNGKIQVSLKKQFHKRKVYDQ